MPGAVAGRAGQQMFLGHSNQKIEAKLKALQNELAGLQKQLESIKAKKERYLDSLINNEFKAHERQLINEKIEEFSLEEKQIKAIIYRQEFEISNQSALIQSIDEFKQEMVFFKLNYKTLGELEKTKWLKKNIEKITYAKIEIKIDFKLLKIGSTI